MPSCSMIPAVERLMVGELERAHGVGDVLDRIGLAVRVVVHGVDAPLVAGAVMRGVEDAVHDRVAHVEVGRGHVDLGAQHARAVGELAVLHAHEEVEILFDGAVAIGAVLAGLGQGAAVLADLVGGEVVDVGLAGLDQLEGPLVELAEVVGGVAEPLPVEAQPADVFLDGVDVLLLFFLGIGVVEAQVGLAAELVGETEIEADGLGVADVEIAVGLGWKARLHDGVADTSWCARLRRSVVQKIGRADWQAFVFGWLRMRIGFGHCLRFLTSRNAQFNAEMRDWLRPVECAPGTRRGPARPWFQTAAARFCGRRRRPGWAGTSGRPLDPATPRPAQAPCRASRDRRLLSARTSCAFRSTRCARAASPFLRNQLGGIVGRKLDRQRKSRRRRTASPSSWMRSRISGVTAAAFRATHAARPAQKRAQVARSVRSTRQRADMFARSARRPWDRTGHSGSMP